MFHQKGVENLRLNNVVSIYRKMTAMTISLVICISCFLVADTTNVKDVLRSNWGVAFHRIGGLDSGESSWTHTFAIPWLEVAYEPMTEVSCGGLLDNPAQLCASFTLLIGDLNKQRATTVTNINDNI